MTFQALHHGEYIYLVKIFSGDDRRVQSASSSLGNLCDTAQSPGWQLPRNSRVCPRRLRGIASTYASGDQLTDAFAESKPLMSYPIHSNALSPAAMCAVILRVKRWMKEMMILFL